MPFYSDLCQMLLLEMSRLAPCTSTLPPIELMAQPVNLCRYLLTCSSQLGVMNLLKGVFDPSDKWMRQRGVPAMPAISCLGDS